MFFIQLSVSGSEGLHKLSLLDSQLSSSGNYRCQITDSKAPFHTEQMDKQLDVISEYR